MKISCDTDRFVKDVLKDLEYSFLDRYPCVIDIGANIGTFSIYIYNRAEKIYAIEPSDENFNHLLANIVSGKLSKISPHKLAIGGRSGTRIMKADDNPGMGGWKLDNEGKTKVECQTLGEFMDKNNIPHADLVKMDVEGGEYEILASGNFPSDRVEVIVGEFHFNPDSRELSKIKEALKQMGYNLKMYGNHFIARK